MRALVLSASCPYWVARGRSVTDFVILVLNFFSNHGTLETKQFSTSRAGCLCVSCLGRVLPAVPRAAEADKLAELYSKVSLVSFFLAFGIVLFQTGANVKW